MDFGLIFMIAFYLTIATLIYIYRKKLEFHKIYFIYKTKKGLELIKKIAKLRVLKYWGYLGIPISLLAMFSITYMLFKYSIDLLSGVYLEPMLRPIVPWTQSGSAGPIMFVPLWIFLVCIAVIVVFHEGAHGVMAAMHKIKLKSTGVGMFLIIPLAFVEPDEKQLQKKSLSKQLSVFAAGPFANICVGIIALLISVFFIAPITASSRMGVEITSTEKGLPASESGLKQGDIIVGVNGVSVKTPADLITELNKLKPGDTVLIKTADGEETEVETITNPKDATKAHLGIGFKNSSNILNWIGILSIGIGLFNLLPLPVLDGGRMIQSIISKYIKDEEKARKIWRGTSMIVLAVLFVALFGPFLIGI